MSREAIPEPSPTSVVGVWEGNPVENPLEIDTSDSEVARPISPSMVTSMPDDGKDVSIKSTRKCKGIIGRLYLQL